MVEYKSLVRCKSTWILSLSVSSKKGSFPSGQGENKGTFITQQGTKQTTLLGRHQNYSVIFIIIFIPFFKISLYPYIMTLPSKIA